MGADLKIQRISRGTTAISAIFQSHKNQTDKATQIVNQALHPLHSLVGLLGSIALCSNSGVGDLISSETSLA